MGTNVRAGVNFRANTARGPAHFLIGQTISLEWRITPEPPGRFDTHCGSDNDGCVHPFIRDIVTPPTSIADLPPPRFRRGPWRFSITVRQHTQLRQSQLEATTRDGLDRVGSRKVGLS